MTAPKIRAILFDMDGVVVDSMQFHLDTWKILLVEMGTTRRSLDVQRHFGLATTVLLREILAERDHGREPSREEVERWYHRKVVLTCQVASRVAEPIPGFIDFARRVRARRLPAALASAASRPFIDTVLEKIGARDFFDTIVSVDDVAQPKPNPEIFLQAAQRLNIPIRDCLVIEDSHPGIEAGVASGATCCALLTMLRPEEVRGAHFKARSFDEIARWLQLVD
ncbi:MAG: HAD family phosphatase [Verrucomicrobiia bacterium]